ncbi:MAG: tetratricopeptide repeat protein, partial [Tidjanibacter sp.]|nr:tetratricopeptide repeat protein [Tidjanibacter sp.]
MNRSIRHRTILRTALTLVLLLCACGSLSAQMFPERKHIRSGNKAYEALDYAAAEQEYRQAQIDTPSSPEAAFNLADALYKQERYEEAENTLKALTEKPELLTAEQAAKVYHNLGNAQFQQQKLNEALESYKQAQRINPDDLETKYNLAYTKKLLEENEN